MKHPLILLALIALLLSGCATAPSPRKTTSSPAGKIMKVRTTAYTHSEPGGHRNGIGGRLRYGGDFYSAASDWSWLPLGTRFKLNATGHKYVIEDYGSALVGRQTIDLYFPSRGQVCSWGVRHVDIEILEWGSHALSLKLLSGRMRSHHVRKMVYALRGNSQPPS